MAESAAIGERQPVPRLDRHDVSYSTFRVGGLTSWSTTRIAAFCVLTCTACTIEAPSPVPEVTLAVVNATVWTGDPARPVVDAVGVLDNRIAAVGTSAAVRALAIDDVVIDAGGAMIVPGFIDSHIHLIDAGYQLLEEADRDPAGTPVANSIGSTDRDVAALEAALDHLGARGVTSVHHMGGWSDVAAFQSAAARRSLTARIYVALPLSTWPRLRDAIASGAFGGANGRGNSWLRVGAVKGLVDGTLATRTAALDKAYPGSEGDRGLLLYDEDQLYAWTAAADRAGLQVAMHAIGARATHLVLNTYARVIRENGRRDRRFRIEHAQHLRAADVQRLGRLGVIASMQPTRLLYDASLIDALVGHDRDTTALAIRSLLDSGARVTFGTDWFYSPVNPLDGLYAAVTRRPIDGRGSGGWIPTERVTIAQAVDAYTLTGAYASFEEAEKGRLVVGQLADFVMLDTDLLSAPSLDIRDTRVLMTVVGGRIVFDGRQDAPDSPMARPK